MKWTHRAWALLLSCVLALLCLASCGEAEPAPTEAKAVFDAVGRIFSDSAIQSTELYEIAERALHSGSLSFSYASPTVARAEEQSLAAHWQMNFREGRPTHLAFHQGERSFALWLDGDSLTALPHGEEAVFTALSKLPDDPIPAGTLSLGTVAANETLSFLRLARDFFTGAARDPLLSDKLAQAMQKNAAVSKASEKSGTQYDFLFSETTLGDLFADVAPLAKEYAPLRYAITSLVERVYEEKEGDMPEDLFSEGGVSRIREDLLKQGSLSFLARFTLKNGRLAAIRLVLRQDQTEIFHLNVSLSDLENGDAEIFAITREETLDRKISWSCERSGRETVRSVRISEREAGYSEYTPMLSIDSQYQPKNGTVKLNATMMGGLLGLSTEGTLSVENEALRLSFDGFRVYYGFLSQTFSAAMDLTLTTTPAEVAAAPEAPREWTTLTAQEIGDVFVGLYPLLRPESEEEDLLSSLLPDWEDILGSLLPLEL